jgi:small subunit ribosomal protein S13e
MGRMHTPGKGISKSALPYRRTPPAWFKLSIKDVMEQICNYARKGYSPSKIGAILRDSCGVTKVERITGNKILRILKANGLAPTLPEGFYFFTALLGWLVIIACIDLVALIRKAVTIRKHLSRNRKDKESKFRLILVESRVHRLARYYKRVGQIPPNWKYDASTASSMLI